jgi:HAD superfamily hydrolase (TIGR01509 family)
VVKAVLSDIDGTLVESNWLHAAAWRDAFAAVGIELELEEVRRQIGKGGDELIPVFVPWWKRKQIEEPLKAYRKFLFETDYMAKVKPFSRVRELMQRMKQAGIKVALASSAKRDELDAYKKIANIEDLVDENTSADDADRAKPHPDIFQATLDKLGLKPCEALALGDTPYDAEAAGKAGLRTIGVLCGGWPEEKLREAGCVAIYRDPADLLRNYDQSPLTRP